MSFIDVTTLETATLASGLTPGVAICSSSTQIVSRLLAAIAYSLLNVSPDGQPMEVRTASRLAGFGSGLLGAPRRLVGIWCAFMGIGAVVEFERANYPRAFGCVVSAAARPFGLVALALDDWRSRRARRQLSTVDARQ